MTNSHRFPLLAAGIFGLIGVALGAFGAHGLQASLAERGMTHAWESAARYQLLHVAALLGAAAWLRTASGAAAARMVWAARCWSAGIVLFSGSLYGLAAGGPRWLGPVTPLGGVAFMAGWLLVALAAFAHEQEK
jgi:uncharacterized membrane protein YgdD (TMEM256/DUF423 family)